MPSFCAGATIKARPRKLEGRSSSNYLSGFTIGLQIPNFSPEYRESLAGRLVNKRWTTRWNLSGDGGTISFSFHKEDHYFWKFADVVETRANVERFHKACLWRRASSLFFFFLRYTLCGRCRNKAKEKKGKLRDSSSNPSSHGWQVIRKGEDIYIYSSFTFKHEYQSGRKSERKRNSLFAVKVNNLNGLVIDIPFFSLSNHTTLAWSNYRRVVVIENWSVRARGEDITIIERCLGWTMSKGLSDGLRAVDRTTFLPG